MIDEPIVDWLYDRYGGYKSKRAKHQSNRRQVYEWRLWDQKCSTLLSAIHPWMIVKRHPAEIGIAFQETKGLGRPKGNALVLQQRWDLREAMRLELTAYNRGTTTSPPTG